jgi:hypothetical protein
MRRDGDDGQHRYPTTTTDLVRTVVEEDPVSSWSVVLSVSLPHALTRRAAKRFVFVGM